MNLINKKAILTGASSGLGAAIAQALVKNGAEVYGLARNIDALNRLREKIGPKFHPVRMNITDEEGIEYWINKTFSVELIPDILINNAGVGSFGKIDEMQSSEWLKMVDTNLNGMYFLTKPVATLMKEKKEFTHIINIGSILGTLSRADAAAYCTTKYGVNGFSEALFKELRFFNIKVSCINPGSIDTDFFESSGVKKHQNMLQPQDLADTVIHVLKTPDNMLINNLTVRPLNPTPPK